ncbi:hypothetical protein [Nitrospira sp. BLG_2]|uniref:hypothetical protein n=1 Tax=Nitrospira sp. BLG_2 TaxID=3397507 RepID=UPI003B9D5A89
MARIKAQDLTVGMNVVVIAFGERKVHKLTKAQYYPPLPGIKCSAGFIAVGTEEWGNGIPNLAATLDIDEEVEIE